MKTVRLIAQATMFTFLAAVLMLALVACDQGHPYRSNKKCVKYETRFLPMPKDVYPTDPFNLNLGGGLSMRRVKVCVEWRNEK